MKRKLLFIFILLSAFAVLPASAQKKKMSKNAKAAIKAGYKEMTEDAVEEFAASYKFRVSLTDKKNSPYSVAKPLEFLSQKAIDRRNRQHISITEEDFPVNPAYLSQISKIKGVKVVNTSKWENTVVVRCEDSTLVEKVKTLPCVKQVELVAIYDKPQKPSRLKDERIKLLDNEIELDEDAAEHKGYGTAFSQINLLNGIGLHQQGFTGKGITIAVVDGGFLNADVIPVMSNINILGTKNFVGDNITDVYGEESHGMMVLSCMGMNHKDLHIGTAPGASYWLLRSEDGGSEFPVEMDNMAAAFEFADSVGADLVNASLGYTQFDKGIGNYPYWQLDGKSQIASRAASKLASKGMILCNSAGNSGDDQWKLISAPADASDILTVGATFFNGENTLFSSLGPAADGRVKPDVMSMGGVCEVVNTNGQLRKANGTSFASPILCGMVACLWQALPEKNAYEIMDLIRRSADRYEHPDNVYGYGIPDFMKAYEAGKKK